MRLNEKIHVNHSKVTIDINYSRPTLGNTTPNMPKKVTEQDGRMAAAIRLYNDSCSATVRQCLLGAEFLLAEAADTAHQMILRWAVPVRARVSNSTTSTSTPSHVPIRTAQVSLPVSPVSTITAGTLPKTPPRFPPPKIKQVRRTSSGSQQHRANMKEASNHHKVAFKAATTLLAEENEKANGMSANQVIDHIQKEYAW